LLQDSALLVSLAEPLVTAAEAHNQLQVERLLRLCQEGAALQEEAERTAEQLKEMYYELTAQLREAATDAEVRRVVEAVWVVVLQLETRSRSRHLSAASCSTPATHARPSLGVACWQKGLTHTLSAAGRGAAATSQHQAGQHTARTAHSSEQQQQQQP
jgi:hypothetical protein